VAVRSIETDVIEFSSRECSGMVTHNSPRSAEAANHHVRPIVIAAASQEGGQNGKFDRRSDQPAGEIERHRRVVSAANRLYGPVHRSGIEDCAGAGA
jgi:hypothetical protein